MRLPSRNAGNIVQTTSCNWTIIGLSKVIAGAEDVCLDDRGELIAAFLVAIEAYLAV